MRRAEDVLEDQQTLVSEWSYESSSLSSASDHKSKGNEGAASTFGQGRDNLIDLEKQRSETPETDRETGEMRLTNGDDHMNTDRDEGSMVVDESPKTRAKQVGSEVNERAKERVKTTITHIEFYRDSKLLCSDYSKLTSEMEKKQVSNISQSDSKEYTNSEDELSSSSSGWKDASHESDPNDMNDCHPPPTTGFEHDLSKLNFDKGDEHNPLVPIPRTLVDLKKFILEMHEKRELEKLETNRNIFENKLLEEVQNHQLKVSQSQRPRLRPFTEIMQKTNKQEGGPRAFDRHPLVINSSLTVYPTADERTLNEKSKEIEKAREAQKLSLQPYELKILQEEFSRILDELPSKYRYRSDIHQFTSSVLDSGSENVRLEPPARFKRNSKSSLSILESVPENRVGDENDSNYESIMNSFRDFCVQCKTFDCKFHILHYPDAATQARVATRYDKRALLRQLRKKRCYKIDQATTHSENSFKLEVDNNRILRVGGADTRCPFCEFPCTGRELMLKHMRHYHADTYYFKEVGNTIKATSRTEGIESIKPMREYISSKSFIPIQQGHHDRDSDDESTYSWYDDYRKAEMDELTDMSEKEKRIQSMWNLFIGCAPTVVTDKIVSTKCFSFVQRYFLDLKELEWEFYQLLITFWERHLLSVIHIEKLMGRYHTMCGTKFEGEREVPLTPRKTIICSRLYLIFESLGGDMIKLKKALNRSDVRKQDLINKTPLLAKNKCPKSNKKRTMTAAMRPRSKDLNRPFFYPCFHAGECTEANGCTCVENDCLCTKHCVWGEFGINFFRGCTCTTDCSISKQCPCRDLNRECDPDICGCCASEVHCCKTDRDRGCSNMDVTLARRVPLLIGRSTVKGSGLGLFTTYALSKGDYIDEYVGEFIKRENEEKRTNEYYFDHSDDYVVDATYQGNKTRFLNHSLTPNTEARHRFVNGEKRIAFYAINDIPAQSELFYSYGKSYNKIWRAKGLKRLCVPVNDDGYEKQLN